MINLLPYTEKKAIERIRFVRLINTMLFGTIILLLVSAVLFLPTFITIANRYELASGQIASLVQDEKIVSDVDVSSLESKVKDVEQKLSRSAATNPVDYAREIRLRAPSDVAITRISSNGALLLEVYGTAPSRESLQAFISSLESDSMISLVDNPLSNLVKTKDGAFKITVTFK